MCLQPKNPCKHYYEGYWLGANDIGVEGTFVWAATRQPIPYATWDGNNPNNDRNEDCVQILTSDPRSNGRWNDISCDHPGVNQNTMCEKITRPGKDFNLLDNDKTACFVHYFSFSSNDHFPCRCLYFKDNVTT
jgi:hypothetical protein